MQLQYELNSDHLYQLKRLLSAYRVPCTIGEYLDLARTHGYETLDDPGLLRLLDGLDQASVTSLDRVMPVYLRLLQDSLDAYRAERYMTRDSVARLAGIPVTDVDAFPPLMAVVSDTAGGEVSSREYSLLQGAAITLGEPDAHAAAWYVLLAVALRHFDTLPESSMAR